MPPVATDAIRTQLTERRQRLSQVITEVGSAGDLVELLRSVDAALERLSTDRFGMCEVCGEDVDESELRANPLLQYCLCELSRAQQAALERDLGLARRVQIALLPAPNVAANGWDVHYRYVPAGAVSGDYLDVVADADHTGGMYLMLGDVSGKGVAAALLMARLNALVRSLIDARPAPAELIERANRLFAERGAESHFATLVCARVDGDGGVDLCNAGHCPPLIVHAGRVVDLHGADGPPLGLGLEGPYERRRLRLAPGDTLVLYSDGITEAFDAAGRQYGNEGLSRSAAAHAGLSAAGLGAACLADLGTHRGGAPQHDDVSLLIARRR